MGALFGDLCNLNKDIAYSETFASIYGCVGFLIGVINIYYIVCNIILVKI